MKRSLWVAAATLCLLCGLWVPTALGQAVYGSILGTVTDPSGAAVNGAKVTVTSQTKNVSSEATTNESGNYSVTHLIPDVYTVRIEGQGFKLLENKNVQVSADNGSRVDGQFQVGGTSETVEVTSEAPQLKTDRADVAVEFSGRQLEELPIFNRNFQSLELLSPGTQIITGWGHAATENPQGSKQIFVNGQHFSGTGYELDGTDNQDPILGIIIVNPSLDSVTETKIATQNYDAEFGKALGGIMTAQTKSGSNSFHGSGYFYDLDPTGPAVNPFTGSPSPNNWKQYGGAVGGPIIKNKLFFFANYEGTRRTSGQTISISVPTNLVRSTCLTPGSATCDLSEYVNANLGGGAGPVYNPYEPDGSRTLYPGGLIPMSVLQQYDPNGVAEHILSLLPAPNATGINNGTVENFTGSGSGSFNDYQYVGRVDYSVNQKLNVFGRYSHAHFTLTGSPIFGTQIGGPGLGYLGLAGQSQINNYSLATGFDYTLSSSLLTDFRFGWFKYNPHSTKYDANVAAATALGLSGFNTADPTTGGLPQFTFDQTIGVNNTGYNGIGEGLNVSRCNCPLIEREQGIQFVNNWTKMKGNHQFKAGVDLRHATNLRVPSDANRTGIMNFNHQGTSNGGTGGLDIATFLFGEVTSFNRYVGSATEPNAQETQNRYFLYAQDTWRATQKLTINYGLRWEFYTPEYVNGKGNGGFAVLPEGVIRVAGYGGIGMNGNTANNYHLFAPRVGVAYEINPKTVIRMGYGRSFDIGVFGSLFGHTVTQNLPVLANEQLNSPTNDNKSAAFNFTGVPGSTAGSPGCLSGSYILNGVLTNYDQSICGPTPNQFPTIPSSGILPLFGPQANVSPHLRPDKLVAPTVDAWNATLQRQLTNKTSLEIAYVGNHGSHVFKGTGPTYNPNQPTVVGFLPSNSPVPGLSFNSRAPYNTAFTTTYTNAAGVTAPVICCSGQSMGYAGNDGTNKYNALQIKLDHRLSAGLTLNAYYTYSRAYDNDGSYQPDYAQGWGRQDFNRDSVLIITSLYELPFGRGKHFMGNVSRGMDYVVGGWQWNATFTIGSGLPWSPGYNNCNFDRDTGPCRPSLNGSFPMGAGSFNKQKRQVVYFTPEATPLCDSPYSNSAGVPDCPTIVTQTGPFTDPGIAAFGTIHRNQFTGPSEFMSDMSIFKNFAITEGIKAQFQAEFFNIFNHPVYALPGNTCIDCSGAGIINSLQGDLQMRQMQLGVRVTF